MMAPESQGRRRMDRIDTTDELKVTFDLLTENPVYKPFRYPWAH